MNTSITLDFFSEIKNIALPSSYKALLDVILKEYTLSSEDLSNLQLKYRDRDNDLIILGNEDDFKMFSQLAQSNEAKTVLIDLTEQSKLIRSSIVENKAIPQDQGIITNFINFLQRIPGGLFFK